MLRDAGHFVYSPHEQSVFKWGAYAKADVLKVMNEAAKNPLAVRAYRAILKALVAADAFVLVEPPGWGGRIEYGFARGQNKPCFVLIDPNEFAPELMYFGATLCAEPADVVSSIDAE